MPESSLSQILSRHRPDLASYETFYKWMHQNPEISGQEAETSEGIVKQLKNLKCHDLDIRANIGGYGVIGVLRNGQGPTVLLRADFDGLPIKENTGLDYASKKKAVDKRDGVEKPVGHMCGHDFHTTSLLATAETLIKARESWKGTAVFVFQPAEETASGAQAMVDDGLYEKSKHGCPIPDVCLGQHVMPLRAGTVEAKTGLAMLAANSFRITIHGRGGHGSMPHMCVDPVVIASSVVCKLQTIVSRVCPPSEMAVVTVGCIQAGDAENAIPEEAVLKLNTRSASEAMRKKIAGCIERIVRAECQAAGCTKDPEIESTSSYPATNNDESSVKTLAGAFSDYFGENFKREPAALMGSEDFSALTMGKPYVYWFFGGIEESQWDQMEKEDKINEIPANHGSLFAPALRPTLKTGVDAMTIAALTFLKSA